MLRDYVYIYFFKDNSTCQVMACIENWMQKAEDNSKNINNLHAQKNRKGYALITQKKNKEKKDEQQQEDKKKEETGKEKRNVLRTFEFIDIQEFLKYK